MDILNKTESDLRNSILKSEWKNHPQTKLFLQELIKKREKLLEEAENLSSDSSQVAKDNAVNKLTSAKAIKQIINYVKE